jgi:hypothetical protein
MKLWGGVREVHLKVKLTQVVFTCYSVACLLSRSFRPGVQAGGEHPREPRGAFGMSTAAAQTDLPNEVLHLCNVSSAPSPHPHAQAGCRCARPRAVSWRRRQTRVACCRRWRPRSPLSLTCPPATERCASWPAPVAAAVCIMDLSKLAIG